MLVPPFTDENFSSLLYSKLIDEATERHGDPYLSKSFDRGWNLQLFHVHKKQIRIPTKNVPKQIDASKNCSEVNLLILNSLLLGVDIPKPT